MGISNTKDAFITAFWRLYARQPMEKMSVEKLCRIAGYNRSTFYNHFENIYDLLDNAVDSILLPLRDELSRRDFIDILLKENSIGAILMKMFVSSDEHIELLFKRRDQEYLAEKVKKEFMTLIRIRLKSEPDTFDTIVILIEYQVSAVIGTIKYWYRSGRTISEEEILKKIYEISSEGVLNTLKRELEHRL